MFILRICQLNKEDIVREAQFLDEIRQIVEKDVAELLQNEKQYRHYIARRILDESMEENQPIVYERLIHQGRDSNDWSDPERF